MKIIKYLFALLALYYLYLHAQIQVSYLHYITQHLYLINILFILFLLNVSLSAYRWMLLNKQAGLNIGFLKTLQSTYIGLAYNTVLPGSVSGDFVRVYHLIKLNSQSKLLAASAVLVDRVIGLTGVLLLIAITVALGVNEIHMPQHLLVILAIISVSLVLMLRLNLFRVLINKLKINPSVHQFYKSLLKKPMLLLGTTILSIVIQAVISAMLFTLAYMLNHHVGYFQVIYANSITQIMSLLPMFPGGLGIGEVSFTKIMNGFGVMNFVPYATVYLFNRLMVMIFCMPGFLLAAPSYHAKELINTDLAEAKE